MLHASEYIWKWAAANLRTNIWTSLTSVVVIALTSFSALTLTGFVTGYQKAFERDISKLGYDVLITAKGCPYEAATLMLRGGVGLQYMPEGVVAQLREDERVAALYPKLIHPVKRPGDDGIALLKGVAPGWFSSLKLSVREGEWFEEQVEEGTLTGDGVVLGFEAAELEGRHAGDSTLLYNPLTRKEVPIPVRGILERTGTQVDGTILVPLSYLQQEYQLAGKLTGVGVRLTSAGRLDRENFVEQYNRESALQVVTLSKVEATLRKATANVGHVVRILSVFLGLLAGVVLLNTAILRTMAERRKLGALRITGMPGRFIAAVALTETTLLNTCGLVLGGVSAVLAAPIAGDWFVAYLPYVPSGDVIELSAETLLWVGAIGTALAALATLPPLVWVLRATEPNTIREVL